MRSQSIRREVLHVAIPAIGEAYLQNVVGVVDMVFISKIGLTAVDAVGVTNVYAMTYIGVFTALGSAASVFMSRAKGAQDPTIGTGFSAAATALIGRSIGEGNINMANEYRRWTNRYSAVAMVSAGALLFVTSPWLGLAFTTNQQVIGCSRLFSVSISCHSHSWLPSLWIRQPSKLAEIRPTR